MRSDGGKAHRKFCNGVGSGSKLDQNFENLRFFFFPVSMSGAGQYSCNDVILREFIF